MTFFRIFRFFRFIIQLEYQVGGRRFKSDSCYFAWFRTLHPDIPGIEKASLKRVSFHFTLDGVKLKKKCGWRKRH